MLSILQRKDKEIFICEDFVLQFPAIELLFFSTYNFHIQGTRRHQKAFSAILYQGLGCVGIFSFSKRREDLILQKNSVL